MELPPRWRILRDGPGAGAWNMAFDEALARTCRPGEGVLRTYAWSRPTLSFGRNQRARGVYDMESGRTLGADMVRRPTGGREVLHDRELTYAIVLPLADRRVGAARELHRLVGGALVEALRALGVPATQASDGIRAPHPDEGPCFGMPGAGEVEAGGRKVVGSAQGRFGGALLQHGSILMAPSTLSLSALRAAEVVLQEQVFEPPSGIAGLLGRPPGVSEVRGVVEAAFAGAFGGSWEVGQARPMERDAAEELMARNRSVEWTWRR